jgi:hypothetical protein
MKMPTLTSRKRISKRQVTRNTAASKSHKCKKKKKRRKKKKKKKDGVHSWRENKDTQS